MSTSRRLWLFAALAASTLAWTGGAISSAQAFSLAGTAGDPSDAYWASLMCGGTKAAKATGSTIDWYTAKTGNDANTANANYEALKVTKPDGIVISSISTQPPVGYIKEMMDAGIPVVYVNGQPDNVADRVYLTGYRSAPADDKMAEVADMIIKETGGKGKMAVLGGLAGLSQDFENRHAVLLEILKTKAPELEQLDIQREGFDANKANEIVSSLIVANPDLKVVYGDSGPAGQGAVAAVKAAGKTGQIKIFTFDAVPVLQDAIHDGTVSALIAQPPGLQGRDAVDTLVAYLKDHPDKAPVASDPSKIDQQIPTKIITKDNIDTPDAEGYLYKNGCE